MIETMEKDCNVIYLPEVEGGLGDCTGW